MKITKRKLDEIRRCYCAASIHMNHENHIIYASEDPDVMCEMLSLIHIFLIILFSYVCTSFTNTLYVLYEWLSIV